MDMGCFWVLQNVYFQYLKYFFIIVKIIVYKNCFFIEVLIKKIIFVVYVFIGLVLELQDEFNLVVIVSKVFIFSLNYDWIDGFNKLDIIIYIQLK